MRGCSEEGGRQKMDLPTLPVLTQGSQCGHGHDEEDGEDVEDFDGHLEGEVLLAPAAAGPCPA